MDLIAHAIAAVLAFFAGIIGNIFAQDICASADSVCARIISAAAARLATFDQTSTEQEWLSDLHEHQTVLEKYRHAVGCYLVAPKMRRCALNVALTKTAPGFYWKKRRDGFWEGRWRSSVEALEKGFMVKSVKLFSMRGLPVAAEEKEFIIARQLQAEHDQWLSDHAKI